MVGRSRDNLFQIDASGRHDHSVRANLVAGKYTGDDGRLLVGLNDLSTLIMYEFPAASAIV